VHAIIRIYFLWIVKSQKYFFVNRDETLGWNYG
jgi:hypothetical protein